MFRNKDNKNLEKIIDVIDKKILNRKIYNYIKSNISNLYNPEKSVIFKSGKNYIYLLDEKTSDNFSIIFIPNIYHIDRIEIEKYQYDRRIHEIKSIRFLEDNIISVIEKAKNIIIESKTNEAKEIEYMKKEKLYQNNELQYSYKYKSSYIIDAEQTKEEESRLYIAQNKSAAKETKITKNGKKETSYSITSKCDKPNYDTRINSKFVYKWGLIQSDKNAFNKLKEENTYTKKLKKII